MIQVFVYGTLKPREAYHNQLCAGYKVVCTPATIRGRLYSLSVGYPAMTDGDDWVRGVLLSFESLQLLTKLDELEDYRDDRSPEDNEYQRQLRYVYTTTRQPLAKVWVYLMLPARVAQMGGQYLGQGYWTGAIKPKT